LKGLKVDQIPRQILYERRRLRVPFDHRCFFEIVEWRYDYGFGAANAAIRLAAQTRESRPLVMPRS
jgi:4-hydroxyphenylpyruvate dioxygenase-like putative hemolysin